MQAATPRSGTAVEPELPSAGRLVVLGARNTGPGVGIEGSERVCPGEANNATFPGGRGRVLRFQEDRECGDEVSFQLKATPPWRRGRLRS